MRLARVRPHDALRGVIHAGLLGLWIAVAGAVGVATAPGAEIEEQLGLRWLFDARGPVAPPADVVVVAIDEPSARALGLPENPRAWPRRLHAELVRHLSAAGARVVAFDLTFDVAGADPADDAAFAASMRSAGNVLLAESIRRDMVRLGGGDDDGGAGGVAFIEKRNGPLPLLGGAASGSAPFLLPKDARVDRYWTFVDAARSTPTLPVLAFQRFATDPGRGGGASGAAVGGAAPVAAAAGTGRPDRYARTLTALRSGPDSRYLNFYGPPRTIETVPYAEVLQAARAASAASAATPADTGRFAGRAVFVGFAPATPGGQDRLRDDYRTVFSLPTGLDLSGVEIAATAFANLAEDRALRPTEPVSQLALVVVAGLVLGAVCRLLRPIAAVPLVAALALTYLAFAAARFAADALWLPLVVPVGVQAPLALFAGIWLNYRDTRRERENVARAFGYFLPRAVVDQLTRELGPMTRANRVVFGVCLTTDAEQYTALAERLDPARLGALMNEYYAELFVPVERAHGVVADVVGDSMVAVWARSSSERDVRRSACRAALEIAAALERFNAAGGDRPKLVTRFGLHCGDMLFGSVGASGHYEYRAVGDIVNTASRIQGLNKLLGTRVIASVDTLRDLDEFATRPLGSFLLAGKANAVSLVELIGTRDALDARVRARCERFGAALGGYAAGRWREAHAAFAAILETDPDDGPTRFYATHCEALAREPGADGAWSPTIRIATK